MGQREQELRRKEAGMLLFAAVDMRQAAAAAEAWAERPTNDEVHRALQTAMIVSYGRPFTSSNFFDLRKSERDYRPSDAFLRQLHDDLVTMRDRAVAHTDEPARSKRFIELTVRGQPEVVGMEEQYEVFKRESLDALLLLFETQKEQFEHAAFELASELIAAEEADST
jgi:hypothetical protein